MQRVFGRFSRQPTFGYLYDDDDPMTIQSFPLMTRRSLAMDFDATSEEPHPSQNQSLSINRTKAPMEQAADQNINLDLDKKRKSCRHGGFKALKMYQPSDYVNWSEIRQELWEAIPDNPDCYFYHFQCPGDVPIDSPEWTEEQIQYFLTTLKDRPHSGNWGLFSLNIPGRTGRQCKMLFSKLVDNKVIDTLSLDMNVSNEFIYEELDLESVTAPQQESLVTELIAESITDSMCPDETSTIPEIQQDLSEETISETNETLVPEVIPECVPDVSEHIVIPAPEVSKTKTPKRAKSFRSTQKNNKASPRVKSNLDILAESVLSQHSPKRNPSKRSAFEVENTPPIWKGSQRTPKKPKQDIVVPLPISIASEVEDPSTDIETPQTILDVSAFGKNSQGVFSLEPSVTASHPPKGFQQSHALKNKKKNLLQKFFNQRIRYVYFYSSSFSYLY